MRFSFVILLLTLLTPVLTHAGSGSCIPNGQSDCTIVTNHDAITAEDITKARVRFPEIDGEIANFETRKNLTSVRIVSVKWIEAFLAKGGVDQSNFADGYCGTNYHWTALIQEPTGKSDTIWFSHFDSTYCGF